MPASTSLVRISDVWTLTLEREYMTVYSDVPEPDTKWRFIDANGHEHTYVASGADSYPTLEWVVDGGYWCEEHNEDHETGHWACRLCGLAVTPGMVGPSMSGRTVPLGGRRTLIYDDGRERWEYDVPGAIIVKGIDTPGAMVDWAEDIAATVEGRLISRTPARYARTPLPPGAKPFAGVDASGWTWRDTRR